MKPQHGGFSLIETLGALAISAMMIVGLTQMMGTTLNDAKGQQASLYQAELVNAAQKYISANYDKIVGLTPATTDIYTISVATLQAANLLSASFSSQNVYGQNACVLVRQPVSQKLDAVVATYGGQQIPGENLAVVAINAGQGGGYIDYSDPTTAQGASWKLVTTNYRGVNCGGGANVLTGLAADEGHLVSSLFYGGPGDIPADFLYRDAVPGTGNEKLNQMYTPLGMAKNALVAKNSSCMVAGVAVPAIAFDKVTQRLLTCGADGIWSDDGNSEWKDSVATYTALPATATQGEVRMVKDISRAFTYDGTGWTALAVDQNGDMFVSHDLNVTRNANIGQDANITQNANIAQNANITQDANIGRNSNVSQDVNVLRDVNLSRDVNVGRDVNVTRNVAADGVAAKTWTYSSAYMIGSIMQPGWACNYPNGLYNPDGTPVYAYPTGILVSDPNGIVMSCYSDNTFRYANGTYSP